MSASLVGSEMCIRDSLLFGYPDILCTRFEAWQAAPLRAGLESRGAGFWACLLYTSDAADDM
eukprot:13561417-Alexandrium_andersonii.AAC.1